MAMASSPKSVTMNNIPVRGWKYDRKAKKVTIPVTEGHSVITIRQ